MRGIYPKGAARRKSNRYMNWDEVPLILSIEDLSFDRIQPKHAEALLCEGVAAGIQAGKGMEN